MHDDSRARRRLHAPYTVQDHTVLIRRVLGTSLPPLSSSPSFRRTRELSLACVTMHRRTSLFTNGERARTAHHRDHAHAQPRCDKAHAGSSKACHSHLCAYPDCGTAMALQTLRLLRGTGQTVEGRARQGYPEGSMSGIGSIDSGSPRKRKLPGGEGGGRGGER